jgi:hypothetical protein
VKEILRFSNSEEGKRGFTETVELQIGLKGYDTQRDKVIALVCFRKKFVLISASAFLWCCASAARPSPECALLRAGR